MLILPSGYLQSPLLLDEGYKRRKKSIAGIIWLQPCSSHVIQIDMKNRAVYMHIDRLFVCMHMLKQIKTIKSFHLAADVFSVKRGNSINEAIF